MRTTAALFDVTPLFKYHVRGRDAGRLLDRVVTRNVSKCRVGQVVYTTWCDDDGKIIDDGALARYGLPEGNPSHGEMTLDQFFHMRPIPGYAR